MVLKLHKLSRTTTYVLLAVFLVACIGCAYIPQKGTGVYFGSTNVVYYHNRGVDYYREGYYDQAISHFNSAIQIDPNFAMSYLGRGDAYLRKGNFEQAISDFNRAIQIKSDYAAAYASRGAAYNGLGDFDQAISDSNRAIQIEPSLSGAYQGRAFAYFQKQEYDKAWENVRKAEALGYGVPPSFIEELRKASGRER